VGIACLVLVGLVGASPRPAHAASPVLQQSSCGDFVDRQLGLADRLQRQAKYRSALRVLNRTASSCDNERVRTALTDLLGAWQRQVGTDAEAAPAFLEVVAEQSYVSASARASIILDTLQPYLKARSEAQAYGAAHQLCRTYSDYVESFAMRYRCGDAAAAVGAYERATTHFAWLLDNWSSSQRLVSRDALTDRLERLSLRATRFDRVLSLAREQAVRSGDRVHLFTCLLAMRSKVLEAVAQLGGAFLRRSPSDDLLVYSQAEFQRVNFPDFVESIYLVGAEGTVQRTFYDGDAAVAPDADRLRQGPDETFFTSTDDRARSWLVQPADAAYFVVQYTLDTSVEEGLLLDDLITRLESETQWRAFYTEVFDRLYPSVGSALGIVLGAAHLGDRPFQPYRSIFASASHLAYYGVQDGNGALVHKYNLARSDLAYGRSLWKRTSSTPALYHHTVRWQGQSVREIVYPLYQDDTQQGVVRVGLGAGFL
jgi:hypothetical protein